MNDQTNEQLQLLKKMHRWRLGFFGITILFAGMVIGAAGAMIYRAAVVKEQPAGIEFIDTRSMQRLQHELNLSEDQSAQIKKIFNEHLKALNDIRRAARPQIAEEMNELYSDVLEVLTDSQQAEWKKSINRLRENFVQGSKGFGFGGGPGGGMRDGERGGPGGPGWQHRPFEMWERKGEGDGQMRRRKLDGTGPGPRPGMGPEMGPGMWPGPGPMGPGMGPGPEGFPPPLEDFEDDNQPHPQEADGN